MSASIKNKEYNVRICFTEDGDPVIGFVQGFYAIGTNCVDIRAVPDSTVLQIAAKLGITRSTKLLTSKVKRSRILCTEQMDIFIIE